MLEFELEVYRIGEVRHCDARGENTSNLEIVVGSPVVRDQEIPMDAGFQIF